MLNGFYNSNRKIRTKNHPLFQQVAKLTVMFTLANLYLSAKRPQTA
jgi:hypothetical protein